MKYTNHHPGRFAGPARLLTLLVGGPAMAVLLLATPALAAPSSGPASVAGPTAGAGSTHLTITSSKAGASLASPAGCTAGNVCFWANPNFSDGPGRLSGRNSNWAVFSHSSCPGGTWNNCASSVYNNGISCSALLWSDPNYGGGRYLISRGQGLSTLVNDDSGTFFDNNFSSNSWSDDSGHSNSVCTGPV